MKRATRWITLGLFGILLIIGLGSCASSDTNTTMHVGVGVYGGYGGYGGYGRGWGYSPGYRPVRPIGRPY